MSDSQHNSDNVSETTDASFNPNATMMELHASMSERGLKFLTRDSIAHPKREPVVDEKVENAQEEEDITRCAKKGKDRKRRGCGFSWRGWVFVVCRVVPFQNNNRPVRTDSCCGAVVAVIYPLPTFNFSPSFSFSTS